MKKYLIFSIILTLTAGCYNRNSYTIKGILKESEGKTIYLKQVVVNSALLVDSSKVGKRNSFRFKVKADGPDFYQLGFTDSDFITILAGPGEKINLEFISKNLTGGYRVTGSAESEKVRLLDVRLNEAKRKLDSLRAEYNRISGEPDFDEKREPIDNEFNRILKDLRKQTIEFIITNTRSMASIKALYQRIDENTYVLYDPRDLQYLKIVSDSLTRYYPESKNVKALAEDFRKELNQMNAQKLQNMASSSPQLKLDPNLMDINGKRVSLSSLKGKVVLVAFWSVNSRECIAENLQLKNIYRAYNKKGFEIYQINLDSKEEKWREQVRFDELPWINTREDDPANPRNAILFNVKSLPANYLFDNQGTLVAMNLHGKTLQIMLDQFFTK